MKLPVFKGLGNEDLDQFWFMVRVVWEAQGVTYDYIKKVTLVTALQDRVLSWYIKHSNDNPNAGMARIGFQGRGRGEGSGGLGKGQG